MNYFLATDDVVGISFWIATAVMAAGALFFWMERSTVKASWQTSLTVACLVCFVAFWHYMYMRDVWVATGESPTVYRSIDWLITLDSGTIAPPHFGGGYRNLSWEISGGVTSCQNIGVVMGVGYRNLS